MPDTHPIAPGPVYLWRDDRQPSTTSGYENRYKLKPTNIIIWNPKEHSAAFFIDRFRDVAEIEGDVEVLYVLPRCLKGDVLEWHTFLPPRIKSVINRDLNEW